jgi:hypothetical protein
MSQQKQKRSNINYQLLISFTGLFLITVLTAFPPAVSGDLSWRKPLTGLIFSTICVLGILAVFSPNHCFKIFNIGKKRKVVGSNSTQYESHGTSNTLQGHHPTCGNYDAHLFEFKGKIFCAACVGLLSGGLFALVMTAIYFFSDLQVSGYSTLIVILGIVGVSLGLFQFKFKSLIRMTVNFIFVIGTLFILIGIDELVHSLFFDLFAVCLTVFWLLTRISLSQWDHKKICTNCEIENCRIRGRKKEGF